MGWFSTHRTLLVLAALLAIADAVYFFQRQSAARRAEPSFVWLAEGYYRSYDASSDDAQIAVRLQDGTWRTPKSERIPDIAAYYVGQSERIKKLLLNSHPSAGDIPIFIALGQNASFNDFARALGILRDAHICLVGFDELAVIDRSQSSGAAAVVNTFSLCR